MSNPFTLSLLDNLSNNTLVDSIAEYQIMLLRLGQFTDGYQIQGLRAQVQCALNELIEESERRHAKMRQQRLVWLDLPAQDSRRQIEPCIEPC